MPDILRFAILQRKTHSCDDGGDAFFGLKAVLLFLEKNIKKWLTFTKDDASIFFADKKSHIYNNLDNLKIIKKIVKIS